MNLYVLENDVFKKVDVSKIISQSILDESLAIFGNDFPMETPKPITVIEGEISKVYWVGGKSAGAGYAGLFYSNNKSSLANMLAVVLPGVKRQNEVVVLQHLEMIKYAADMKRPAVLVYMLSDARKTIPQIVPDGQNRMNGGWRDELIAEFIFDLALVGAVSMKLVWDVDPLEKS